jgi:SAM-dependent methyltransferase
MKKFFVNLLLSCFVPYSRKIRNKFLAAKPQTIIVKESDFIHKYLDGLNGIEIGGSVQNPFGLERFGAYANVDFEASQGGKWQDNSLPPKLVNIVSSGDNLPFKDNSLDYVISSHVIEHFFDPVSAIQEWIRVIHKGGFVVIIAPQKERTFDRLRPLTSLQEITDRHSGKLSINDYSVLLENSGYHTEAGFVLDKEYQVINKGKGNLKADDHHHWSVFTLDNFTEMCNKWNFNIIETQDPDDKIGNGFTIVIQKK